MEQVVKDKLMAVFPAFSHDLLQEISKVGSYRKVRAGTEIMDAGQLIREIPLILEGRIKVFRPDAQGNELFLYFLHPGDACALSLVCSGSNGKSNVRAETTDDSEIVAIPVKYMDEWMRTHKTWYHYVLGSYRARFEEVLRAVDGIAFHKMDERLLRYLLKNQEASESDELNITHQDIAYELNSSREVISRLLKKLEQKGLISLGRNSIRILKSLESYVDY